MNDETRKETISFLSGKTIALAIPGDTWTNLFSLSLINLISFFERNNVSYFISNERRADMTNCRNRVLLYKEPGHKGALPFNGLHYDYILWLDTDVVFSVDHFLSLISRDRDIISGCYPQTTRKMVAGFIRDDGIGFLANSSVQRGGLIEVDFFGFGFLLVKQGVFEHIGYPWFYPRMNTYSKTGTWTHTGEDISICRKLKENYHYPLWLDLDVRLGHHKRSLLDLSVMEGEQDEDMVVSHTVKQKDI